MKKSAFIILFFKFFSEIALGFAQIDVNFGVCESGLLKDLMIVDYWNRVLTQRLPVTYNHYLQGGYFIMPSARVGAEGEISFGYSHVPPYRNYNLRLQLTDRLEVSGNYRIFRGVEDPILSPLGFGDLSDKGANIKLVLFHAEDSDYELPGFAIGLQDFMGTQGFKAQYATLTQVLINYNLELTLGYGGGRIHGLFGGVNWMPFFKSCSPYLKDICLTAEYDATPYHDPDIERHPKGRKSRSPINFGFKYRLWNFVDFSISSLRGRHVAASIAATYNFGYTKGLVPKIDDTLPYIAPKNVEPLGCLRSEKMMSEELFYAFAEQGFDIYDIWSFYDSCAQKHLRITIYNTIYREESNVRERLNHLLAYLIPEDVDIVLVTVFSEGFPVQEYRFVMNFVREWGQEEMGDYELKALTPLTEATFPNPDRDSLIFEKRPDRLNFEILPKTRSLFGSSKGKFKYSLGINAGINGFIGSDIYYSVLLGWNAISDMGKIAGVDRLNPSRLINVRTDIVRYYQQKEVTVDEAYLQRNWNMGCGLYSRLALGHFEVEYGGVAAECLYYPINSCWAIGAEGAVVKKRTVHGIGFTGKIRKLDGWKITHKRFLGSQGFLDFYYYWKDAQLKFKIKAGKFLANDWGVRYELSRLFPSGLNVTLWYTYTNGHDKINGKTYYDKGVAFSMPLDIFYTHSDRTRWGYGMSAWLRDVGATAATGNELYDLIFDQRY